MSKLKAIREQQNFTQEEISEKSGVSVRTIQRIESGKDPKGYTLRILAQTLGIEENELTTSIKTETVNTVNIKIKLINLSSLPFTIIPIANIIVPIILIYVWKIRNPLTKQIVSIQIVWTIIAPIIFLLGVLLKLGNQFTLLLMVLLALSNVVIILRNAFEIDKNKKLYFKLNFNLL
ncbi:helix-turn-helix domain-containing protein [Sediminibacterium sp.]|uniref:helix-turn-helix domain-containing protein n=1 Tax=Sediminibacterium sp. TaxID=1917865 RepID=UPI003F71C7ED